MGSLELLPANVLTQHILPALEVADLCRVACTCRLLRQLSTGEESLWLRHCQAWLAAQASPCNGLAAWTAEQLGKDLKLGGRLMVFQVGTGTDTVPDADPGPGTSSERGTGTGSLLLREPRPRMLHGPVAADECWDMPSGLAVLAQPDAAGRQVQLRVLSTSGFECYLQLSLDGQALKVHRSREWREPPPAAPGARLIPPACAEVQQNTILSSSLLARLARHMGGDAGRLVGLVEQMQFRRAALPHPSDLAAQEGEPPGMALLRQYQGLWQSCYGPHGLEVLHISASSVQDDVPPLCPVTGPRLQGLKLLGDINVPALKYSFVVDGSSVRLGEYEAGDDPFAPGEGLARPVLCFYESATLVVELEARPVRARFRAVGCINAVPGLWQPEWVPATLLLYHPPMERCLTVIFEDEGEPFRHALDFQEFPFVTRGFASNAS